MTQKALHFLHSLVALTKQRDIFELEQTLKSAIKELIEQTTGDAVSETEIYHLRDVSKLYFTVISEGNGESKQHPPAALCHELLACYNTGEYRMLIEQGKTFHFFPLVHDIAYQNAVVMVEAPIKDEWLIQAVCKLLHVYQNYLALLNDNERDTLTGLLNRKTFDLKINKILAYFDKKHQRKNDRDVQVYYLAIFDIDHFKKINDEFGHLIGDEVLLLFSQLMTKTFRESDPLFRFGGEEFVGVFGCVDDQDIKTVLNRFQQKLAGFTFPQVGKVSVSIGCARLNTEITPSHLVDRADMALYYAKNNGRNQIAYYEVLVAEGKIQEEVKSGEIELF